MSFMVTGAEVLEALESTDALQRSELMLLVDRWIEQHDRSAKLDSEDGCNEMHILGAALCVLLQRREIADAADVTVEPFDLRATLGTAAQRVLLSEKQLTQYDIEDLHALVTALQLEFASLYALEAPTSGSSAAAGFFCIVNMELICLRVLGRLGALLANKERLLTDSSEPPPAAVRGLLDVDDKGFCSVRADTVVYLLDALHSMLGLHALLTSAEFVPAAASVELHAHHREASNETFFTHSMTSDCVVGTIAQYAHRFAHLFHSVSQAVYYNFPSYARQKQMAIDALQRTDAPAINVLPLLTELRPDIPVLFEHTGAGCRSVHARHKWSWVLWSRFVLLVDCEMRPHAAADIRSLLTLVTN